MSFQDIQSSHQNFEKNTRAKFLAFSGQKAKNASLSSSRLPGFFELPMYQRIELVKDFADLSEKDVEILQNSNALNRELTDIFIENAVGSFTMPLGIATNFLVNGKDYLVPMAVEESSVLAAASHAAKLIRKGGGFLTSSSEPIMTGQIQLFLNENNPEKINRILKERRDELIRYANQGHDRLLNRGGGAKDMTWKFIPEINALTIHLHINTGDAMGANIVNTMCEKVSTFIPQLFSCEIGLRILTNLNDRRTAKAECLIPADVFDTPLFSGKVVTDRIEKAYLFAFHDIYRAATNNKGVMNGIDSVLIATGNDWRAIEAGAHAYCSKDGHYKPMASWKRLVNGDLYGCLELPMAVGTVGGVTKLHPIAKVALKILGNPNAKELAEVVCCAGLAQNLAALRALGSEGIQKGHMSLHQKNLDLLQRAGNKSN